MEFTELHDWDVSPVEARAIQAALAGRVIELGADEVLRPLLGRVAADDGKRLFVGRRPVAPEDAEDGNVGLGEERVALRLIQCS